MATIFQMSEKERLQTEWGLSHLSSCQEFLISQNVMMLKNANSQRKSLQSLTGESLSTVCAR